MNLSLSNGTILINKYRIIKELGKGGFSRTYLIENIQENFQQYLLKEFLPNDNIKTEFNQKSLNLFNQEASILSKLKHPQIPRFLDWFQENNNFFIVQEYIKGDNYWQLLYTKKIEQKLFSESEIVLFLKDLLIVLDYIHHNRIIHRDISPDNIIYSTEINKPVLIDFGGVKEKMTEIINHGYKEKKGTIIGKRGYSAPEQLTTGECYQNSDIYALGATALVLLTGKEPEILFNSFSRKKSWIEYVNFSEELRLILEKMLEEYPQDRYNSAMDVLADLEKMNKTSIDNYSTLDNEKTHLIIPLQNITKTENDNTVIHENLEQKIEKNTFKNTEEKSFKNFILLSGIIVFSLTIITLVLQAPHINAICKRLDNCARDKQYQEIFNDILVDGKEVMTREKNIKKIEDLTLQQQDMQEIIKDFKNIPNDVKVYDQAQQELKIYQDKLTVIDKKIQTENQTNLEFQELVKNMDNLKEKTSTANTIKKNRNLKLEWEQINVKLNEFNSNLLISSQVSNKITETEENIAKINQNIQNLQAQAKAKADRIAKEKVQLRTYTSPSSPVVKYTAPQKTQNRSKKTSKATNNNNKNLNKNPSNYTPKKNPPTTQKIPISAPGSVW
ncbi:serine/threonine kinase [Geminocystis sp. NIES-3708]|uniref:serine/threonine-protein kinase n=1 Tax=Geminocystis sp. NIES-3708 TaxID=1615909 RepID=UPI0005FCD1AA|nr:serine/threonine-protein kinase [Geminocystis sp. NIES-3708]BAQ60668.1 serine/threonine kinase [Geminocystis sp. NIES-3708]